MNGLCEQCQLYYPMPPDFAEGVPYACPECGGTLVPWDGAPAETTGAVSSEVEVDLDLEEQPAGEGGEDAWENLVPDALPPPAEGAIPTVRFPPEAPATGADAADAAEAPVPAEHARDDILTALSEMTDEVEVPAAPAEPPPGPGGAPEDDETSPADAPTRFVHRGAGQGVARESLPPLPPAAPPEAGPVPPPRTAAIATASARKGPPPRRGRGWMLAAVLGAGLAVAAGAGWWFGVPWLGLPAAGPDFATVVAAPEAAREEAVVPEAEADEAAPDPEGLEPEATAPDGPPEAHEGEPEPEPEADRAEAAAPVDTVAVAPADPARQERALRRVREGNRLLKEGRVDPAIQAFEQALLLDARNGFAHRGLGIAYARLGRAAEAAREYELYLQLVPDAPEAGEVRRIVEAYYTTRRQ